MKQFLLVTLIAFSTQLFGQDKTPVGTILPVQLKFFTALGQGASGRANQCPNYAGCVIARRAQDSCWCESHRTHCGCQARG